MSKKYLRDSVTGRPYDPITKEWFDEAHEAVRGDYRVRAIERAPQREVMAHPVPHTSSTGFAVNPAVWLSELEAAQFTDKQIRYLQSNAFAQYEAAQAAANDPLAARIIEVWRAWLTANPPQ